jgi:hypothetical protein
MDPAFTLFVKIVLTIVLFTNCLSIVIEFVFNELIVAERAIAESVTIECAIRELNDPSWEITYPV